MFGRFVSAAKEGCRATQIIPKQAVNHFTAFFHAFQEFLYIGDFLTENLVADLPVGFIAIERYFTNELRTISDRVYYLTFARVVSNFKSNENGPQHLSINQLTERA